MVASERKVLETIARRNIAADRERTNARVIRTANRTATGAALLSALGPEVLAAATDKRIR